MVKGVVAYMHFEISVLLKATLWGTRQSQRYKRELFH